MDINNKERDALLDECSWQHLVEARKKNDFSIQDVALKLKITKAYVLSLEQGIFEELPEPIFVRWYVKKYTEMMAIDDDQFIRCVDACINVIDTPKSCFQFRNTGMFSIGRPTIFKYSVGVILTILIIFICYFFWKNLAVHDVISSNGSENEIILNSINTPSAAVNQHQLLVRSDVVT